VRDRGDIRLLILRPSAFGVEPRPREAAPGVRVLPFAEVKAWFGGVRALGELFRSAEAELATQRIEYLSKPFLAALMLRALSRGPCYFSDDAGARVRVGWTQTLGMAVRFARELAGIPQVARHAAQAADGLVAESISGKKAIDLTRPPLYLRGDLQFGLRAGGSVGHIAGVLNNLHRFVASPVFVTSDRVPTVRPEIETHVVAPARDYCGFEEIPQIHFNGRLAHGARTALAGRRPSFVYQRCGLFVYAGLALARELGVPFVLEYNGSEVWSARHWGTPLRHEALATRVETVLLEGASMVTVVSKPLRDELLRRGIARERILLNPNGVDPDRYSPAVDGAAVRGRLGLDGKRVVGFIGTFGRWHGAEALADAFGRLMARRPDWRDGVRLLLIGDGLTRPEVEAEVARGGVARQVVMTGLVPQEQGPAHLAACDVLVSPQVRNPDGTPFFGSPTKLFEYMAMGKAIVASELDQMGEVLAHEQTALLVEPGDTEALAAAIERVLADDGLRQRLGEHARRTALARHTWSEHTRRIVAALAALS
jgi:glycosyltransferase involved in cell wall biosynthesis